MKKAFKSIYRFLGSLQLAVLVIIALAIISAIGTIMEARYNTETAQKLVYHSPYMFAALIMLVVTLIVSVLHRWPWKKRHIGFIVAHVGILILLFGSYVTKEKGIDGSISFGIGETQRSVTVSDTEFAIYVPIGEGEVMPFFKKQVDFLVRPPEKENIKVSLGNDVLQVVDYYPYAIARTDISPTDVETDLPAVRFQLSSDRVNVTEWIQQMGKFPARYDLGPAQIVLSNEDIAPSGRNEILLKPVGDDRVQFTIHSQRKELKPKKGVLKIGDVAETGWMNMKLRLLNYYPHAKMTTEYQKLERPTPLTSAAIKVKLNDNEVWVGLNSTVRLFTNESAYYVSYRNRQIDLGFDITLKEFQVGRYQGTMRAASYESLVHVKELGDVRISMNEPLHHKSFTFYQASFQEDPSGKPTTSILSVNYDPGRWLKYLGSALIVLGSIIMFYFRRLLLKSSKETSS